MVVFGLVGLVGNVVGLLVLAGGRDDNLNMRAAFLEVLNDALGSVAVLLAAVVIALTGWMRADAVASLVIGVLIIPRTVRLLAESVDVLLESTPKGLDLAGVRARILSLPHVHDLHDLHASQVATGLPGAHRARRGGRLVLPRRPPRRDAGRAAALPGRPTSTSSTPRSSSRPAATPTTSTTTHA